jgi:hypothetical protein
MVLQYPVANSEMPVEVKIQDAVLKFETIPSNPSQQSSNGE